MKGAGRLAGAGVVAIVAGVALAAASRAPWSAGPEQRAALRLAWRARAERVEECRPLTEAEKAERPPHMRPDEVCEGRVLPYRLTVRIDGATAVEDTLHGAGAREDRPIYVFRDLPVEPGERAVEVRFERLGARRDGPVDADASDGTPTPSTAESVPPELSLTRRIRFGEREVAVVGYDPDRRRLVRVTEGGE